MATLGSILNLVQCGLNAVLGTGTKGCRPFLKKVTTLWFLPSGFVLDKTRELNLAYVQELQATGKLIVLKGIRTFTDNTPDDTFDELEDGTKQVARLGLYEFMIQFISGLYFHAAIHTMSGYGNYDTIFWDRDGNGLGTKSLDGSLKGFTTGMVQASKLQWATDSAAQREGLAFQLLERSELDIDYVFIQRTNIDFNANRIDGINELVVDFDGAPTAGTSLTLKVSTKQDNKPFTGLAFGDFSVKNGTTPSDPTAGDDSATPGTYVLTVATTTVNDELSAQVYDTTNNRAVVMLDTDQYKSNIATATVV